MKHHFRADDRALSRVAIRDVASNDFDVAFHRRMIEPAPAARRIVMNHRADRRALAHKLFGEMAADKPGGTRHQHFAPLPTHFITNGVRFPIMSNGSNYIEPIWSR